MSGNTAPPVPPSESPAHLLMAGFLVSGQRQSVLDCSLFPKGAASRNGVASGAKKNVVTDITELYWFVFEIPLRLWRPASSAACSMRVGSSWYVLFESICAAIAVGDASGERRAIG